MIRLKELREKRTKTQSELGKDLKISASAIGMYEQGRREPDIPTLKKLATYFNVSVDYLLDYTPATPPASPTATDQHAPSLTPDEQTLIKKYRALPPGGKDTVQAVLNVQYDQIKPKSPDDKAI